MNKKQVFVSLTWLWLKAHDEYGEKWSSVNTVALICYYLALFLGDFVIIELEYLLRPKKVDLFLYIIVVVLLAFVHRLLVCLFCRLRNMIIRHKRKTSEQDPA